MDEVILSVSDFVGLLNQTLEFAYPNVVVQGELANFRVSKNKWVYFDLKDEYSSVKFFGTVFQLPGPLEDGMLLQVRGNPRLHNMYGFSINVVTMQPVGEGSLKKAAQLLEAKLKAEGLFSVERKRPLPYPPQKIGLITSRESAAYHDFVKILNQRWGSVEIVLADVQVQGEAAPSQIVRALEYINTHGEVDVIVITRGGGSTEDLAAFSTEQVTRAVAASRIPTLVAIGHEVDISLAELVADVRASTPSNAAERLVPDRNSELIRLHGSRDRLHELFAKSMVDRRRALRERIQLVSDKIEAVLRNSRDSIRLREQLLAAFNPQSALTRGYALVKKNGIMIRSVKEIRTGDRLTIQVMDGTIKARAE